jgi:hypothetical protein
VQFGLAGDDEPGYRDGHDAGGAEHPPVSLHRPDAR